MSKWIDAAQEITKEQEKLGIRPTFPMSVERMAEIIAKHAPVESEPEYEYRDGPEPDGAYRACVNKKSEPPAQHKFSLGGTGWFTVEDGSINFYMGNGKFSHRIDADRYHLALRAALLSSPEEKKS